MLLKGSCECFQKWVDMMGRLDSFPAQTAEMKVHRGPEIEGTHWRFQVAQARESGLLSPAISWLPRPAGSCWMLASLLPSLTMQAPCAQGLAWSLPWSLQGVARRWVQAGSQRPHLRRWENQECEHQSCLLTL